MMVWPIRTSGGRIVLVDAGFYREKFIQQWKPSSYVRPSEALATGLGIKPEDVTDVILTHVHWDHADGADLFPRAHVWIQRQEYEHHIGEGGTVLNRAVDPAVAVMLFQLRQAGRLTLVEGDDREIAPGVRVYTGGKHTFESQYVSVANARRHRHPRLRQRVPLREPREAPRHRPDRGRRFQSGCPEAHGLARRRAQAHRPRA